VPWRLQVDRRLWSRPNGPPRRPIRPMFYAAGSSRSSKPCSSAWDSLCAVRFRRASSPATNTTTVAILAGHPGVVNDIAFSPDGARIATASEDGRVQLFDAETGAPQLVLPALGCAVEGLSFGPDGTKLASSSWCDGVRIWALDIDDLLEIADREAGRSLTDEECRQYLHVDRCPSG